MALPLSSFGAANRYMVFFKDKNLSSYSMDKPEEFLSARAIERRNKQHIAILPNDLPVSDNYVQSLREIENLQVYFTTKWFNGALVEMDDTQLEQINALEFVEKIAFVAPGSRPGAPMDNGRISRKKHSANEYDGKESLAQNEFIGVDAMHGLGFHGEGMLIGVFDSGFEFVDQSPYFSHIFQNQQMKGSRDFVHGAPNVFQFDSHGSKVLSCISALNPGEYVGTAPLADLLLCVTEDLETEYKIEEYNWLFAAEYADSAGVDIINSSVGYSYFDDDRMDYTYEDMDGNTAVITKAADFAASKGILVVASVGNEGNDEWKYLNAPADGDSVFAIGAVTFDGYRSNFSSFGPSSDERIKPDISSLGTWVRVAYKNDLTIANGTSFSAPMVTGLAAGLWQAYPQLSNMEVIQYLKITASQSDAPDTLLGYGIPDFIRAYNKIKAVEGDVVDMFVVFPNPVDNRRVINFYVESKTAQKSSDLNFFDLRGSLLKTAIFNITNETDPVEIDVTFLKPGSYILTYQIDGEARKSKLIVQ